MPEVGTVSFYREEAARIGGLAREAKDQTARLELMEIAAKFMKLARFAEASANSDKPYPSSGAERV